MTQRAVVLLSGGIDSMVAALWAQREGYALHGLSFDYGQRHGRELDAARRIAERIGVAGYQVMRFEHPAPGDGTGANYIPARNTIFLAFALAWAETTGSGALVIGANADDRRDYPDCRPDYLAAFERVARLGTQAGMLGTHETRVLAPLVTLSKAEVIRLGVQLGAAFGLTWTCYRGGAAPCRECSSCRLRADGFRGAGVVDPLEVAHALSA